MKALILGAALLCVDGGEPVNVNFVELAENGSVIWTRGRDKGMCFLERAELREGEPVRVECSLDPPASPLSTFRLEPDVVFLDGFDLDVVELYQ